MTFQEMHYPYAFGESSAHEIVSPPTMPQRIQSIGLPSGSYHRHVAAEHQEEHEKITLSPVPSKDLCMPMPSLPRPCPLSSRNHHQTVGGEAPKMPCRQKSIEYLFGEEGGKTPRKSTRSSMKTNTSSHNTKRPLITVEDEDDMDDPEL